MGVGRSYYQYMISLIIFLLTFLVYLSTLCPTVPGDDSGELITVCYTLGIAHPPGYPLYALIGKLFTLIPVRSIAFRVNMMSAFFASLTAALIYLIILELSRPDNSSENRVTQAMDQEQRTGNSRFPALLTNLAAVSAALLFAFSKTLWSQAVIAEVYTIMVFFVALMIFMLLKWRAMEPSARRNWFLWIGAFIYGLSLGARTTMIIFAPAFLIYIIMNRGPSTRFRTLAMTVPFFLLGSCVYLYLPIRSLADPPMDWGDPENWGNFFNHVTARQYRFMWSRLSSTGYWAYVREYAYSFATQFTFLLYPLGIIGAMRLLRNSFRESVLLGGIFLIDVAFNNSYGVGIKWHEEFFIPSFIVFAIWTGWGMKYIMEWLAEKRQEEGKQLKLVTYAIYPAIVIFALAPILPYRANHDIVDQSSNVHSHDYGKCLLDVVEDNAVIITCGMYTTFPLWYFQHVQQKRPDVNVVDATMLTNEWYQSHIQNQSLEFSATPFGESAYSSRAHWLKSILVDLISKNIASRPFYVTLSELQGIFREASVLPDEYILVPAIHFSLRSPIYQLEHQPPELAVSEPIVQNRTQVSFSNSIELTGYNAEAADGNIIRRGDIVRLTYYWKLLDDAADDLTARVIFTDAEGGYEIQYGAPSFNNFHKLAYGMKLTDRYEPGQVIMEECKLVVPSNIEPGTYYMNVAVEKGDGPLEARGRKVANNFAEVGAIYVE